MTLAPIAIFVYNRFQHTQRTLQALSQALLADRSELYIFSDAPKRDSDYKEVKKVREFAQSVEGFLKVHVIERETNYGLASNIRNGIRQVLKEHSSIIVMEDDLLCSKYFLKYHNSCLVKYHSHPDIQSISGFCPPIDTSRVEDGVFLLQRPSSWGWSTWKERWESSVWDASTISGFLKANGHRSKMNVVGTDLYPMLQKKYLNMINSWAVVWAMNHMIMDTYSVYPVHSLIKNIGTDGSGTNFVSQVRKYEVELADTPVSLPDTPRLYPDVAESFKRLYDVSVIRRLINLVKLDLRMSLKTYMH